MFSNRKSSGTGAPRGGKSLSFLGPDVVVSGDISGTARLHIDGRVDGNVECETLVQGDGGTIAGHIKADVVHLAGLVDGTVSARLVTLEASARVTGDVTYETLSIAAGAAIEGRLARQDKLATAEPPLLRLEVAGGEAKAPRRIARNSGKEEPGLLAISTGDKVAAAG